MTHESQNKTIKVAAFTGRLDDPASYFRMRQYFPKLQSAGLKIQDFNHPCVHGCWHRGPLKVIPYLPAIFESRKFDLIWLCRTMVRGAETFERLLKRPRVMDVDDAIWLNRPLGRQTVPHIARGMDAVIAGNQFLADWFGKYCRQVYIVPTAIDLERYRLRPSAPPADKFVIGWTGTSSNFKYLRIIEKPLLRFLSKYPDSQFKIIADARWRSDIVPPDKILFVPWSRDIEVTALYDMSVGVMPLADNQWTRGKCGFKVLQYMAVGLPVIASPVGMNNEILEKGRVGLAAKNENEWYEAFEELYRQRHLGYELGKIGRKIVEEYFSAQMVAQRLFSILKTLAE
jgi:glycosyltransferase involved in cell wall biosynthesis